MHGRGPAPLPTLQAPQILFIVDSAVLWHAGIVREQRIKDSARAPPDAQPPNLQRCHTAGIALQQSVLPFKRMQPPGIDNCIDAVCGARLGEPLGHKLFSPDMRGQRREGVVGVEKDFYACGVMACNHSLEQALMALSGDVGYTCFGISGARGGILGEEQTAFQFQTPIPITSTQRKIVPGGVGVERYRVERCGRNPAVVRKLLAGLRGKPAQVVIAVPDRGFTDGCTIDLQERLAREQAQCCRRIGHTKAQQSHQTLSYFSCSQTKGDQSAALGQGHCMGIRHEWISFAQQAQSQQAAGQQVGVLIQKPVHYCQANAEVTGSQAGFSGFLECNNVLWLLIKYTKKGELGMCRALVCNQDPAQLAQAIDLARP